MGVRGARRPASSRAIAHRHAGSLGTSLTAHALQVGEAPSRVTIENDTLRASSSNPVLVRKDRVHAFEWRIRNLPYPKPTYSVEVDEARAPHPPAIRATPCAGPTPRSGHAADRRAHELLLLNYF